MSQKECCTGNCQQGRNCISVQAKKVDQRIATFIFTCFAAAFLFVGIGVMQNFDEGDAQTATAQVMACSVHPDACREFKERREAAEKDRR